MGRPDLVRLLSASAVALVATACQTAAPTGTPAGSAGSTPPGSAPAESGATGDPGATAEPSAVEGEVEIGDGDLFLDPRVGLDGRTSYTQTLTVSFDGTADGQARSWSKTYRLHHTAQPAVSVLTLEASGDTEAPDPRILAEADGGAYEVDAAGACSGVPFVPERSSLRLREPAGLLPALLGAEAAGSETVDGVAADHYTFDGRALLESGGPATTGEVWVSADAGYVIRYLRTTTADAEYFGDGHAGTMTWEYRLSDIDALTSVGLPDACRVDAPITAGAENVLVLPRYIGFDTQSSVAEVIAYYKRELPRLGWAVTAEPFTGATTAVVEFGKGDYALTLIVTTTETGRRVDLAVNGGR